MLNAIAVKLFPNSITAKREMLRIEARTKIHQQRLIADTIEAALVRGLYQTEANSTMFMCTVVNWKGGFTDEAIDLTTARIMKEIYPNEVLFSHLHECEKVTDIYQMDPFERRIICSNWYWGLIRRCREQADFLEDKMQLF